MAKKKNVALQGVIAVIYARYSSHAQNDASIEQQVAKCEEYAAKTGLQITATYADRAVSGKTDRRPEFQKMMKDAQKGKFQCVVAWKSNRMGRNMLEAMLNDAKLLDYGIRCMYVEEDFGDTAAGRFALRNMMNVNQFYSENMAEDIARGLYDNAKQCKVNGSLPLGYKRGADGKYEIDEAGAEIVREIFRRIVAGDTLAAIADDLNKRSITTSLGRKWGKNSFHSLMQNERYIGVYKYGDVRIENGIPPIVDREMFYIVREKVGRRKEVAGRRRENEQYLLTGKLFCGKCLSPMTGISGTSKTGAMHFYYVCRKRRAEHTCNKANVRKEYAERLVASALKEYVLRDDVIEWVADETLKFQETLKKQSQLAYYQDKLVEVKRSLDNIMKAIEAGAYSSTMQERMQTLETEEQDLQAKISVERASIPTVTKEQIIYYMESFKNGNVDDPEFQKSLFDGFLEAAYLYDDKIKIVFNYTKGENEVELPIELDGADELGEGVSSFNAPSSPPYQKLCFSGLLVFLCPFSEICCVAGDCFRTISVCVSVSFRAHPNRSCRQWRASCCRLPPAFVQGLRPWQ